LGGDFLILSTSHHFYNNTRPNLQTKVDLTQLRSKNIKQFTHHAIPNGETLLEATSHLQTLLSHIRVIAGDPNWDRAHAIEDYDNMALGLDRNYTNYIYVISALPKNYAEFRIWIGEAAMCIENSTCDMLVQIDRILGKGSIDQLLSRSNSKLLWLDIPSEDFSDSTVFESLQSAFSKYDIHIVAHWDNRGFFRRGGPTNISLRVGRKRFNYLFECTDFRQPL
jgi:histidinol phosphatase-like PHP family hydrolase